MRVERGPRWSRSITLAVSVLLLHACIATGPPDRNATVLRVMLADDWATAPAVANAVTSFEAAHPDVRVAVQGVPFAQIPDALRAARGTGRDLDVVQWHAFALAEMGLVEEISDLWDRHGVTREEWLPGALEDIEWEGGLYGIPLDTNALVMLVNREAMEEAHVEARDLSDAARLRGSLERFESSGRRGIAVSSSGWSAFGWIRAFGGQVVLLDEDRVDITFDDPRTVAALEYLGELVSDELAVPPTMRDLSRDAASLFATGLVAVHVSGSWDVAPARSDGYVGPDVEVLPMPRAGDGAGTVLGGSSLSVAAGSPRAELAMAFMLHMVEDEWVLRYAAEEGRLPARQRMLEDDLFDEPTYRTVVAELPRAAADRLIAFPRSNQAFRDALDDVLLGRASAADALARAQKVADAELEERS